MGKLSSAKGSILSSNEYSSLTLEKPVHKEKLTCEMLGVGHSVIKEKEEDEDSFPDLATVETALDEKNGTEIQGSEKPQEGLLAGLTKGAKSKEVKVTLRRVSTRRKKHHIETAEVIFNDQPSDESDDDDTNNINLWVPLISFLSPCMLHTLVVLTAFPSL